MMRKVLPLHKKFNKSFEVPGSKSYTNRALLIAALAKGKSILYRPLLSDDTVYMIKALKSLGVSIVQKKDRLEVWGTGGIFKNIAENKVVKLYLGNAGTAVRFLTAALSLCSFKVQITGNKRMQERPIQDLVDALRQLGAQVETTQKNGCPPIITGGGLQGGAVTIQASDSSQFLSAVLMAAPYAEKQITIKVKRHLTSLPYITMTLDIMEKFGVKVRHKNYQEFLISPQKYKARSYIIEPDASSATYPMALAAIHQSKIIIPHLGKNSQQADMAFVDILKKMGSRVMVSAQKIMVSGPAKLKPLGTIDLNKLPDAAMTVAILAACAKGKSKLTGLGSLRLKETDRLHALAVELTKVGAKVKEGKDYLEIDGDPESLSGACIETYDDHRMAMCFAVLGTKVPGMSILNPECVSKTYPTFWKDMKKLGVEFINQKLKGRSQKFRSKIKSFPQNIVLIGMRGSGKSTIGKAFAKLLGYDFIDTDVEIERKAGQKISEIVIQNGWPYFRRMEYEFCKELGNSKKKIIATGGGMILNPKNQKLLKKSSLIVFLFCELEELKKRLQQDYSRPALTSQKNLKKELEQIWQERKDTYYAVADICFNTSDTLTSQQKAKSLLALLQESLTEK